MLVKVCANCLATLYATAFRTYQLPTRLVGLLLGTAASILWRANDEYRPDECLQRVQVPEWC